MQDKGNLMDYKEANDVNDFTDEGVLKNAIISIKALSDFDESALTSWCYFLNMLMGLY